ncbi:MAG: aldose 1-epimerase family protein [Gemmataceae bacterium]
MHRCLFLLLLLLPLPANGEPFRKVLISSKENLRLDSLEVTGKEITPKCAVPWSVRKQTLHGGKQEGVDIVVIDNGKFEISVVPTRGMGILSLKAGQLRLGWDSPVTDVVHPKFVNLNGRGGLGWLDGFNEWMCRCGLESAGGPGPDKFINNIGDEATMDLTLHGKIANLPAQFVELSVDREAPYAIHLKGTVDEKMLFGPKLELATELIIVPGAASFRLEDTVINRGTQPQEFEMIYHTNFGTPLLEKGAVFMAPLKRVSPFNERAAKGIGTWNRYAAPTSGFIEQVYLLEPLANEAGNTLLLLRDAAAERGATLRYSIKELPCLTLWKNTGALADGYVTGLEPGTNYPNHRSIERKQGRLQKIPGGGQQRMTIDFGVLTSKEEVSEAARQITAIQGKISPTIDKEPPAR